MSIMCMIMASEEGFYLVLPSNVQPDLHTDNTASYYRTTFNESFHLEGGDWEVALHQITFVNAINNITEEGYELKQEYDVSNYYFKKVAAHTLEAVQDDYPIIISTPVQGRYTLKKRDPKDMKEYWASTYDADTLGFIPIKENRLAKDFWTKPWCLLGKTEKEKQGENVSQVWKRKNGYLVGVYATEMDKNKNRKISLKEKECYTHQLKPGYYPSAQKLCEVLNPDYHSLTERMDMEIKMDDALLELSSKNPSKTADSKCNVKFDYDANEDRIAVALNRAYTLTFTKGLHDLLGFKDVKLTDDRLVHIADKPPILNRAIYSFYIYCSLCAEVQVGNTKAPLLQTVGLDGDQKWGDVKTLSFTRLMYVPVACTAFNSVEIQIRDDVGQLIRFGKGKTVLTLHLRKKPTKL